MLLGGIVGALAAGSDLRLRLAIGADEEDAAVLRVGDRDRPVLEQISVVGLIEIAGLGARRAGMAVLKGDVAGRERDPHDRLVVLLVRDQPGAVLREERVVREVETTSRSRPALARVPPENLLGRVDEQQPVVAPVGDQEASGKGGGHRGCPGGSAAGSRLQHDEAQGRCGDQRYSAQKTAAPVPPEVLRVPPSSPQCLIGECQVRRHSCCRSSTPPEARIHVVVMWPLSDCGCDRRPRCRTSSGRSAAMDGSMVLVLCGSPGPRGTGQRLRRSGRRGDHPAVEVDPCSGREALREIARASRIGLGKPGECDSTGGQPDSTELSVCRDRALAGSRDLALPCWRPPPRSSCSGRRCVCPSS